MVNNTNAMRRSRREKGFFVSFDYTDDALREIDRFFKADHAVIIPLTVRDILGRLVERLRRPAKPGARATCSPDLNQTVGTGTSFHRG